MRTRGTRLPWRGAGSKGSSPRPALSYNKLARFNPTMPSTNKICAASSRNCGTANWVSETLLESAAPLPIELQRKLHRARIGLYVGNTAERAAGLADRIGFTVRPRGQAVARVRQPQVLMIQRVEHLPAELEVALLG